MNNSKIYFYYDFNRPKRDLESNMLQVYILSFKVLLVSNKASHLRPCKLLKSRV